MAEADHLTAADELTACLRLAPDDVGSLLALARLDLQVEPTSGAAPWAALTLAERVTQIAGSDPSQTRDILARSPPAANAVLPPDRRSEVAGRIERCVDRLPAVRRGNAPG